MYINQQTGLLREATFIASPNFDARPNGVAIDLIVIHCISLPKGVYNTPYIKNLFLNKLNCQENPEFSILQGLKVSAHLLINRQGELTQFVAFKDRAWHAGQSNYNGREQCNDFSVGIELEGTQDSPFTDVQYDQLNQVIKALRKAYPSLSPSAITGHEHIAPGRKMDPGKFFNWSKII